jgi:hypothetical protein
MRGTVGKLDRDLERLTTGRYRDESLVLRGGIAEKPLWFFSRSSLFSRIDRLRWYFTPTAWLTRRPACKQHRRVQFACLPFEDEERLVFARTDGANVLLEEPNVEDRHDVAHDDAACAVDTNLRRELKPLDRCGWRLGGCVRRVGGCFCGSPVG